MQGSVRLRTEAPARRPILFPSYCLVPHVGRRTRRWSARRVHRTLFPRIGTMATASARDEVRRSCRELLRAAISVVRDVFGASALPERTFGFHYLEPSGPGRHSGRAFEAAETDFGAIDRAVGDALKAKPAWTDAVAAIDAYIEANKIEALAFGIFEIAHQFLLPTVRLYLIGLKSVRWNTRRADRVIAQMLKHLDDPAPTVTSLIALEDFAPARGFALGKQIQVRPIRPEELVELGRDDTMLALAHGWQRIVARSDWWIAEVVLPNPRGTAEGFNKSNEIQEWLALALRIFKDGGMGLAVVAKQMTGPFERMGRMCTSVLPKLSHQPAPYVLSEREVREFVRFWAAFRPLVESKHHYLQGPLRRSRSAAIRTSREDALVDYVVGLESLLTGKGDISELGYRIRMRGAVVLAATRSERRRLSASLRDLYNLRSRIVHGGVVTEAELDANLPVGEEALRRIWRWYFTNWRHRSDNEDAIKEIDDRLVGP